MQSPDGGWLDGPRLSLLAGGVLVASASTHSDERKFVVGFAAAGLGYVMHLVTTKRRSSDPP